MDHEAIKALGGIVRVGPTCYVIAWINVLHKLPGIKDLFERLNINEALGLWKHLKVLMGQISIQDPNCNITDFFRKYYHAKYGVELVSRRDIENTD